MILWGLRESVNETTGVSPYVSLYTMVYGRLPHGQPTVLRNIWIGEDKFPIRRNKTTTELKTCVIDWRLLVLMLRHMLKKSSDVIQRVIIAMLVKIFFVGEFVLVLQKNSTLSQVFSKWIGPAIVVEIQFLYLYVVFAGLTRLVT